MDLRALEPELLELQRAGVLGHIADRVVGEPLRLDRADLHPDPQLGSFHRGQVLQDLLRDAGQVPAVTLGIDLYNPEEPNVLGRLWRRDQDHRSGNRT